MTERDERRWLDDKGRCCGRKPLVYKRPRLHLFCPRCDREYDANGQQQANWAYPDGVHPKFNSTANFGFVTE
jgi:hypothetical protein